MPSERPVIALDIGNVCLHLELTRHAQAFGYADIPSFEAAAPDAFALNDAFHRGEFEVQAFLCELRKLLPSLAAWGDEAILDAYRTLLGNEVNGMAALVDEWLAMGLRPVFFSDINPVHWCQVQGLLSFADRVPDAVLSHVTGDCKPNSPMYVEMEARFGSPCLYLDDKPENVAAGRARGWHSHQVDPGDIAGIRAAMEAIA